MDQMTSSAGMALSMPASKLATLFLVQTSAWLNCYALFVIQLQHAHKGLLRDLHIADLTHALLSFLLLL